MLATEGGAAGAPGRVGLAAIYQTNRRPESRAGTWQTSEMTTAEVEVCGRIDDEGAAGLEADRGRRGPDSEVGLEVRIPPFAFASLRGPSNS